MTQVIILSCLNDSSDRPCYCLLDGGVTYWRGPLSGVYMWWFNFIFGSNFIFLCFKLLNIRYHTPKQRKIKFKPRIKLNHNIYIPCLNFAILPFEEEAMSLWHLTNIYVVCFDFI